MSDLQALVLNLHHAGHGIASIANALTMTRSAVWQTLKDAGIARAAHRTRASARGEDLANPKRADAALRKF